MSYIFAVENTTWKIDLHPLITVVLNKFGAISLEKINDTSRPYNYFWRCDPIGVEGFIHRSGDSLHLSGNFDGMIDLIFEILPGIPDGSKIHLFDQSYDYNIVLDRNTARAEIYATFTEQLRPSQES